ISSADESTVPALLAALQTYFPASCSNTSGIDSITRPSLNDIWKSALSLICLPDLNHLIVGSGLPFTMPSKVTRVPSSAARFLSGWMNCGGTGSSIRTSTCWNVGGCLGTGGAGGAAGRAATGALTGCTIFS
ncbi:hypothetical protein LSH36_4g15000, partial [Paralvinella palmiformis]